jgi:hypothetical protein
MNKDPCVIKLIVTAVGDFPARTENFSSTTSENIFCIAAGRIIVFLNESEISWLSHHHAQLLIIEEQSQFQIVKVQEANETDKDMY